MFQIILKFAFQIPYFPPGKAYKKERDFLEYVAQKYFLRSWSVK